MWWSLVRGLELWQGETRVGALFASWEGKETSEPREGPHHTPPAGA